MFKSSSNLSDISKSSNTQERAVYLTSAKQGPLPPVHSEQHSRSNTDALSEIDRSGDPG